MAFLYALDADLAALRGDAVAHVREVNGTVVQSFQIGGHRVSAARMGVGNIETALNGAQVIGIRRPDLLIAAGPAGALKEEVPVGSVHRVVRVIGYQRGTFGEAGWALASESRIPLEFPAMGELEKLPTVELASGDAFVAESGAREQIQTMTGALLVDMNSYGLASACRKARTPLVILKVVSDRAGDQAVDEFRIFAADYDGGVGRLVREMIEQLPVSKESPEAYENIRLLLESHSDPRR